MSYHRAYQPRNSLCRVFNLPQSDMTVSAHIAYSDFPVVAAIGCRKCGGWSDSEEAGNPSH
jgi:hypothetical protein